MLRIMERILNGAGGVAPPVATSRNFTLIKRNPSGTFTEVDMDIAYRKSMLRMHNQPEILRPKKQGEYLRT